MTPSIVDQLRAVSAANPAAITELLDRLEAAEQTAQDYLRIDREKAQIAQRLEAAEKERDDIAQQLVQAEIGKRKLDVECDALRAENAGLVDDMNLLRNNNATLRARIKVMEKQEPGFRERCTPSSPGAKGWDPAMQDTLMKFDPANVPDGWQLVPKKITPHMGHAGEAKLDDDGSMQAIWDAMLAAAPEAK